MVGPSGAKAARGWFVNVAAKAATYKAATYSSRREKTTLKKAASCKPPADK
jgi:hypothetical protein